jgi:hypothetical protein
MFTLETKMTQATDPAQCSTQTFKKIISKADLHENVDIGENNNPDKGSRLHQNAQALLMSQTKVPEHQCCRQRTPLRVQTSSTTKNTMQ